MLKKIWVCLTWLVVISLVSSTMGSAKATVVDNLPDTIEIQYITVPSVLLADLTSQTIVPGQGITGTVILSNPLHSFYLSLNTQVSSGAQFEAVGWETELWDLLKMIKPGGELKYKVTFTDLSQTISIQSNLVDETTFAINILTVLIESLPGVEGIKSSSEIIKIIKNLVDLKDTVEALKTVYDNFKEIVAEPLSWQTPARTTEIAEGLYNFATSDRGKAVITKIVQALDVTDVKEAVKALSGWAKFYTYAKFAVDIAVYLGMTFWHGGSLDNQILISAKTFGPGIPPASPRLIAPLGQDIAITPTFQWGDVLRAQTYLLEVATDQNFSSLVIREEVSARQYQHPSHLLAGATYYWRVFARSSFGNSSVANIGVFHTGGWTSSPVPGPSSDDAIFLADVTLPDNIIVSSNQSLTKSWRMTNTGSTTWGGGYQLAFVSGEQMGAPFAVDVTSTTPGQQVDLSVNMTSPTDPGDYAGYWQLRNPQGTFFGDKVCVQITVQDDSGPTPTPLPNNQSFIELSCDECLAQLAPGQTFRPTIRAKVNGGQLLGSRGDMLLNVDGNLYGAYDFVAVPENTVVNPGQTYDFTFYADNPIRAPETPGVYQSTWRIWRNGHWDGDTFTIQFEVEQAAAPNHAPNAPNLTGPGDWAVYYGNTGINLSASPNGDPDGDSVTECYFEIFESAQLANSGWVSSCTWSPQGLGFNNYQWHVKARDSRGAESGWSNAWHFSLLNNNAEIYSFSYQTCRDAWGGPEKICFCAQTNAGTLKLQVNLATDGSANGEWKGVDELGTPNYNCNTDNDRPPNWGQLEYPDGTYRFRLYARREGGWENAAIAELTVPLATNRRPNNPPVRLPQHNGYVNDLNIHFDWDASLRTTGYRLEVSPDAAFSTLLVDTQLAANVTEYDYTLPTDYETVYWRVTSYGEVSDTSNQTNTFFHVDLHSPASTIAPLPPVTYETKFSVNWSGADERSGMRWYHVQVRDNTHSDGEWQDWLVNTTKTAELFQGQAGHVYNFRVRAMDTIGNWEAWPAGDGDTTTVIDPASAPPDVWWNAGWALKRNLVLLNNDSDAIPVHFPMHLHFDGSTTPTAAEVYNASLTAVKGDDIRIVYQNQTELNRTITKFTASEIDIWFPLQEALAGGSSSSGVYQMYFGNAAAGSPPADVNAVYLPEADGNTVGLWHFQEGNGNVAVDTSGRGHNGTFYSPAWYDYGLMGRAGSFNGVDAYVDMGNLSDFNMTAMTLEAWIYVTNVNFGHIFSKWGSGGSSYFIRMTSDRTVQFQITGDGGDRGVASNMQLDLNRWYHVAGVHDGGNNMWVFINGEQRGHNSDSRTPNITSSTFRIGRDPNWNDTQFPGYIQHARASNVARFDFPYARIDIAPSVEAGAPIAPPVVGNADLALLDLTTYPDPNGGFLVQAVFQNQGNLGTQNGFFTDLYINHLPVGGGDYTGSLQFWINDPISAGATVTVTAALTDLLSAGTRFPLTPGSEITATLYAQVDSAGSVTEPDDANNIFSAGVEVCMAAPDAYEGDETSALASGIGVGTVQLHNFDALNDQDWLWFNAETGKRYIIQTSDLGSAADTYLYLYASDGVSLLAANDDFDGTLASQIEWESPSSGMYYILARHWNPNAGGCGAGYSLSLIEGAYNITGVVLDANNTPLPGVLISVGTGYTATTQADGSYILTDLPVGSYLVIPYLVGYSFTPSLAQVNVGPDAAQINFVGTISQEETYIIAGKVTDSSNDPLPGVLISAGAEYSTTTQADGSYVLTGLPAGAYLLTPSKEEYTFTPITIQIIVGPDAVGVDFVASQAQVVYKIYLPILRREH